MFYTYPMQTRNTKTKQYIIAVFQSHLVPLTLDEVHEKVKQKLPKTAYSTVFRVVQSLVRNRKLHAVDWKDRGGRYEWAQRQHHHHLVCNSCGDISDIHDSVLNIKLEDISKKTGFIIKDHSIELMGTCSNCQTKL